MRVLHLIDPGSPGGGACTLRLLAEVRRRLTSVEHHVIVIDTRDHADLARRCGVAPDGAINAPARVPALASRPLRHLVDVYEHRLGPIDLVHAWTARSAMLATVAVPRLARVGTMHVGPVSGLMMLTFRLLLDRHPMAMLAGSTAVQREYKALGLDERLLATLPPAVDPDLIRPSHRTPLRRGWNAMEDDVVVGLMSEPVSWADAQMAGIALSQSVTAGRRVRLVVHPSATRLAEVRRWLGLLGMETRLIIEDDRIAEPWRIVPGLDVALLVGGQTNVDDLSDMGSPVAALVGGGRRLRPMPGTMPLLWAMAARLPVIAESGDAVRDIIEDGVTGLLVNQYDVNAVADRMLRLTDDVTIRGRIGAAAQALVTERFGVAAYCVRLKSIYEDVIAGLPPHVIGRDDDPDVRVREPLAAS